jgi:hypothetical protein
MRRFLFWNQQSSIHDKPASKTHGQKRRFRSLAFQSLERRDLKAADTTTTLIAPSEVTTDAHVAQPVTTSQSPVASVPTQQASQGSSTGNAQSSVSTALLPQTASGAAPSDANGVQQNQTPVQPGPTAVGPTSSATAQSTGSAGSASLPASGPAVNSSPAPLVAPPAAGNNGAANATPNTAVNGASATSCQDGYGGTADGNGGDANGYGGDTGYGGDANGYGGDASGYGGDAGYGGGPHIDGVSVNVGANETDFNGSVSGEANLAGATVTFGGQLAGQTVSVDANNHFRLEIPTNPPIHGMITVQITDANGVSSDVVTVYVS